MTETARDRVANHWWWRPGWGPGTRYYTWHLTFEGQHALHGKAQAYRDALAPFEALDPVPDRWLHLTMQGLGPAGEVSEADARAIAGAAAGHLAKIGAFDLVFDRPTFTPEAIRWDPDSAGPAEVRRAIRAAIGEVWPAVPEPEAGFGAHVTIAYGNRDADAAPVIAAIEAMPAAPVTARVTAAELIVLGRDDGMYEWETFASVPLAGA